MADAADPEEDAATVELTAEVEGAATSADTTTEGSKAGVTRGADEIGAKTVMGVEMDEDDDEVKVIVVVVIVEV